MSLLCWAAAYMTRPILSKRLPRFRNLSLAQVKHAQDDNRDVCVTLTRTEIRRLRVLPLREELARRGLDTTGTRPVLVSRLIDTIHGINNTVTNGDNDTPSKNTPKHPQLDPNKLYVLRVKGYSFKPYSSAGVGLVLYDAETVREVWVARKYFDCRKFPFELEYRGVLLGLEYARQQGATKICLQTDNHVLLQQLDGLYTVRKDTLRELRNLAAHALSKYADFQLTLIASAQNTRATNLARRAVGTKKSFGLPDDEEKNVMDKPVSDQDSVTEPTTTEDAIHEEKETVSTALSPDKTYLLRFDGGSRDNGSGIGGCGMILYDVEDDMREVWCGWKFLGEGHSNNEAEYHGLLLGMKCAISLGVKRLVVEGDSLLVVRHLNGIYSVRGPELKALFDACKETIEELDSFEVKHIPRAENKRADQLANQAIDTRESFGFEEAAQDTVQQSEEPLPQAPLPGNHTLEEETDVAPAVLPDKTYLLRFDGGSRGNPGDGGCGMVLYDIDTMQELWSGYKYLGTCTNNEAEYNSLLLGIQCAISLGVTRLRVEGDSLLVVRQLNGTYRVKSPNLKVLFDSCMDTINTLDFFEAGHITRAENSRADELANEAMDTKLSFGFDE